MELSVDFRVLGAVEVRVAGRPLSLGAPQTRAVLAVLLARRGEVTSVDRLADELWPDGPPEGARSLVHGHVSRIRRALRASPLGLSIERRLMTRKPGYLLCLEDRELDLARFERALTRARAARQGGDLDRCVELHRRAHAEWRGEPYADVPATPRIAAEAVRLTSLRLDCLEERFDVELTVGRHGEAVGELTALVANHPLRERLAGQLMLALYRLGNTAEALAVYQRTRRQLAGQLGLDPGAALRGLHTAIVRSDPALSAPARPVGPISDADSAPPVPRQLPSDIAAFTGRSYELARLEQRLAAAGGQGPVVISAIQGAGGIGKSAWRSTPRTGWPRGFPTGSCTWTCTARPSACSRWRRWRCWAGSCARSACSPRQSPPIWKRPARHSAPSWLADGSSWCWTTPPMPPRSRRCCRASRAAACW